MGVVLSLLFHMVVNLVCPPSHFPTFVIEMITTQKLLRSMKLRGLDDSVHESG